MIQKIQGRSSRPDVFWIKSILKNCAKFTGKIPVPEFRAIFKNTFFNRTPLVAASFMD